MLTAKPFAKKQKGQLRLSEVSHDVAKVALRSVTGTRIMASISNRWAS